MEDSLQAVGLHIRWTELPAVTLQYFDKKRMYHGYTMKITNLKSITDVLEFHWV